jgi:hypothetical protein
VANTRTMIAALELAGNIRSASILAMHHALMNETDPINAGRWRSQFAEAAFKAVANGRVLVDELRRIRQRWQQVIKARSDSAVWRFADLLLRRPVVNARVVAEELDLDVGNVHRYVTPLLDAHILVESLDVKRNQVGPPSTHSLHEPAAARAHVETTTTPVR